MVGIGYRRGTGYEKELPFGSAQSSLPGSRCLARQREHYNHIEIFNEIVIYSSAFLAY
jgi:hypothetical protein